MLHHQFATVAPRFIVVLGPFACIVQLEHVAEIFFCLYCYRLRNLYFDNFVILYNVSRCHEYVVAHMES